MTEIISSWIISIVGIVILGVLIDLILPEGQMQKYIKSIFSVIVVLTMVSPVLNIDLNKIEFNKFIYNESSIELNDKYLKNYNEDYKKTLERLLENSLEDKGYKNVSVEISYNLSNNYFEIQKVVLNIKNLVINTNQVHIDKYKEMRAIAVNLLNVKEGVVVIYE